MCHVLGHVPVEYKVKVSTGFFGLFTERLMMVNEVFLPLSSFFTTVKRSSNSEVHEGISSAGETIVIHVLLSFTVYLLILAKSGINFVNHFCE